MGTFSWSFTKFKNYDTCPKKHYEVDLAKNYKESTDALDYGNAVHQAMEHACRDKTPLPVEMKDYQKWVDTYTMPMWGDIKVEQQYTLTRDWQVTHWKDWNKGWFRGKCDLLRVAGDQALAVDWKTGSARNGNDSRQLMMMAQCVFLTEPKVNEVTTHFVWLKEGFYTEENYTRANIYQEWPAVLDQVKEMEEAARTMNYPPKPNKLCARYCPVVSCPHHGKRHS